MRIYSRKPHHKNVTFWEHFQKHEISALKLLWKSSHFIDFLIANKVKAKYIPSGNQSSVWRYWLLKIKIKTTYIRNKGSAAQGPATSKETSFSEYSNHTLKYIIEISINQYTYTTLFTLFEWCRRCHHHHHPSLYKKKKYTIELGIKSKAFVKSKCKEAIQQQANKYIVLY